MEVLLCEHVNDLRHSLFHLLNCLITTASELIVGITKSHKEKSTILGNLMPNPLYKCILDIYDLVWLGFMV